MTAYQKFKNLPVDHSAIGLGQSDTQVTYFCTPKDARIIGCAGVDGIHYCTVPKFGETVFAVSPMNFGDYVHPIAKNFRDLLRMLLYCADMAALEQCYAWDEEQFKAFLIDCSATKAQLPVPRRLVSSAAPTGPLPSSWSRTRRTTVPPAPRFTLIPWTRYNGVSFSGKSRCRIRM